MLYNKCFQTSDMQFGFKQQHSTSMCSLYHEVITHYLCNGSNYYRCLLDVCKAFDRVHYGPMFSIILLLNKNVPYCIIILLMDGKSDMEFHIFQFKERGKQEECSPQPYLICILLDY